MCMEKKKLIKPMKLFDNCLWGGAGRLGVSFFPLLLCFSIFHFFFNEHVFPKFLPPICSVSNDIHVPF